MQTALNDFVLNEVVHAILFLNLLVLYTNSLWENRIQSRLSDRYFSAFILSFTVYIGLMLPWLWLRNMGVNDWPLWGIGVVRVLAATAAYSFVSSWLVAMAEAKTHVPETLKKCAFYGPYGLFFMFLLLIICLEDLTFANIPLFFNYVMFEAIIIKYRKEMGMVSVGIITMFIGPTLLLQMQEWWNYTPANIYVVLGIMVIYSRMWLADKEEYSAKCQLYALQAAELKNAKTRLMLSQIKPHFIYNTLGSIAHLCTKNPEQAKRLTLDFASYLRGNLHSLDSSELVPFATELEHVRAYLRIEEVRFKHILQVKYDIQAKEFKLPVLTVEPLVENAVKHGVCKKVEGSTVTITTCEQPDCYRIIIQDNGAGFDMSQVGEPDNEHVGIRSVRQRIELLCHGTLHIESTPGQGTVVTLMIPKGTNFSAK